MGVNAKPCSKVVSWAVCQFRGTAGCWPTIVLAAPRGGPEVVRMVSCAGAAGLFVSLAGTNGSAVSLSHLGALRVDFDAVGKDESLRDSI
jgi:hypothetical protein